MSDKLTENEHLRQQFPPFVIPTDIYQVIHMNKYTSMEEMQLIIDHVKQCNQFTIDTESEKSNGNLALMQIQLIPSRLPFNNS